MRWDSRKCCQGHSCTFGSVPGLLVHSKLAPCFSHVPGYRGRVWDTQLADVNWEGKIFLGP